MSRRKNCSLAKKALCSLSGLAWAFRSEKAFRNETAALVFALALALYRGVAADAALRVFLACLLPMTAELVNTAAEITLDFLAGPVYREEVRAAKDMLSAAVLLALLIGYGYSLLVIFF